MSTLRVEFAEANQAYDKMPREKWLFDYPAQVSRFKTNKQNLKLQN